MRNEWFGNQARVDDAKCRGSCGNIDESIDERFDEKNRWIMYKCRRISRNLCRAKRQKLVIGVHRPIVDNWIWEYWLTERNRNTMKDELDRENLIEWLARASSKVN